MRRLLLALEWVLLLGVFVLWVHSWHGKPAGREGVEPRPVPVARTSQAKPYSVEEEPVETFPFDPNTADSTALLRLGLAPWQVRAIYKYRAHHGRYHQVSDFKRTPGMTQELWERLEPFVRIDPKYQYLSVSTSPKSHVPALQTVAADTLPKQRASSFVADAVRDTVARPIKYQPGTLVDVNHADTSELKHIPGIASYRAQKIVEYRQRLGGFVNVEQVMEACQLPDELLAWFTLQPVQVTRIDLNHSSIQKLMRHPYITFYQARDIIEYRKVYGDIHDAQQLLRLSSFSPSHVERLLPYLEFK